MVTFLLLSNKTKKSLLTILSLLFISTYSQAAPPVAPDCPELAIPDEFIIANYSNPVVKNGSGTVIGNNRAKVGGYALYSNMGIVNTGNATVSIDMKVTFVSTSDPSNTSGYIEFGVLGNDARWRANDWDAGDIHNIKVEYFVSGTSTLATYSGIWNFSDLDQPSSSPERVYMPTNVLRTYLRAPGSNVSVATVGSDFRFTGSNTSSGSTNNLYAFAAVIENIQSFDMKLQNGGGSTTFFINGNNFNYIPSVCNNYDKYSTNEDNAIIRNAATGLLSNDYDNDGDNLTITQVQGSPAGVGNQITIPSGAKVTVSPDGSFTYNPNPAYNYMKNGQTTTDLFYYQVSDGNGGYDLGTVIITITGVNDPPVAINDFATSNKGSAVDISVLTNDTDIDGVVQPNTLIISTVAKNGTASILSGVITYTPNSGFSGLDSLEYEVCDDGSPVLCDKAWVYITVTNLCGIAVTTEPASCPSGSSLSSTVNSPGNYIISGSTLAVPSLTVNVGSGNAANIYICSGKTLDLGTVTLTSGTINVYVLTGGLLRLTSNISAGNYYVFGTVYLNSFTLLIQDNSSLQVGTSGIVFNGS